MKKFAPLLVLFSVLILLATNPASSQISAPGPWRIFQASEYTSSAHTPAAPSGVGYRDVIITVNYIGNWTPDAMAAFEFAAAIWEEHLTSDVQIRVDATMAALPVGQLGGAGANFVWRDFESSDPCYMDNVWYADAQADKLADMDLSPSTPDIVCTFTTNAQLQQLPMPATWYFGTDANPGANQFDFVTVILHELGHGLGFFSSAQNFQGTLLWGIQGFPVVFDRFVVDGNGTRMTDLIPPSVPLTNFLLSGDVFFDGGAAVGENGGNNVRLFAPNPFQQGSSISHFDENTFPPGNANSLMTPFLARGEAIHQIGAIAHALMEDVCWTLDFPVGIEDEIKLKTGPNVLDQGGNFTYTAQFYDEYPYGDYIPYNGWNWEIRAFHSNGSLLVKSQYNINYVWTSTLGYLPFGPKWARNSDGTVRAEIKVFATDNDGFYHEDSWMIGIKLPPDRPTVYLVPQQHETYCNPTITFHAPGATSYQIFWDINSGHPYTWTTTVPGNVHSYTFTNLLDNYTYFFNVRAINSAGSSMYGNEVSGYVNCGTVCCYERDGTNNDTDVGGAFSLFPNPASTYLTVTSETASEIRVTDVYGKLLLQTVPNIHSHLDIADFPAGTYFVTSQGTSGNLITKKFVKAN